ncbi:ABC transporter B family member 28 isoform X1 [Ananas comosus]|uniref:ABC transporter B family member 28 isoform X1 n=1 Tax=Ananas comosus TaxID=4615 RepID=A0A6P5FU11_ANACO|nr:ABC transporter B family member 28 isoform X1 [Ananas comosus]
MASLSLVTLPSLFAPNPFRFQSQNPRFSPLSFSHRGLSPRLSNGARRRPRAAYVSAPASDPDSGGAAAGDGAPAAAWLSAANAAAISWAVVWPLILSHKMRIAASLVSLVACTTCTLAMPLFSGNFFEILIGRGSESLWKLLSKVAALYILEPIFTIIFVINMTTIWEKVMTTLRGQIFRRILVQKVEFFDRHKVGELTGLLTSDLGALKDVVNENISRDRGLRALSEVIGTICILFTLSSQLAPVLGLLMVSISLLVAVFKRSTIPIFKSHGMVQARIADCATETFSAIRTVRSFGGERRQISMFNNLVLAYQNSGIKLGSLKSANESLTRVVIYISLLTLYILGGSKVKAGELSVGTMASFIGYTFTLTFAVQGGVNTLGDLRGMFAAAERINSIFSEMEIDESLAYGLEKELQQKNLDLGLLYRESYSEQNQAVNIHYMSSLKSGSDCYSLARSGDICLEDVHFSYPLRSDVEVLNGLNLTIKSGKITALVGPSGAGKSTVVQLLARFYEPTRGRITVAGEDVRTFDKREWARVVSLVNQDPVLFSVSVGENIAYGLPDDDVSKDDIVKAAKAANAHEFIISLPQGYDTLVGERGSLLSGGQRQRVAIARALLKNAPILILDEATSALDATSERLVQEALDHLMNGRTSLVIAHRLSTVQNAHQIALCSGGKIMELGTHSELLAKGGQYASLVATQRLAFE